MKIDFSCLSANRAWLLRYFYSWIALVLYGAAAFSLGEKGTGAIGAQALFFLAYFALVLWPIRAAFGAACRDANSGGKVAKMRGQTS